MKNVYSFFFGIVPKKYKYKKLIHLPWKTLLILLKIRKFNLENYDFRKYQEIFGTSSNFFEKVQPRR